MAVSGGPRCVVHTERTHSLCRLTTHTGCALAGEQSNFSLAHTDQRPVVREREQTTTAERHWGGARPPAPQTTPLTVRADSPAQHPFSRPFVYLSLPSQ